MNGDGLPDIVAIGPNGLYITYAQSAGTLSSAPAIEVGQVSTATTLVDVNGDGNLDVVSAGDTALKLSLGHGDGTFDLPKPISTSGNFGTANYVYGNVISGDFNGDGKADLLATGSIAPYTSQNYILFGHGDGTFDDPKPIAIGLGKVADIDGDGRSDVVSIQNGATSTNQLVVNLSRGDGTFTTVSTNLPAEPNGSSFVYPSTGPALADFRHIGRLDAAIAGFNNAYLLRSRGDGTFDTSTIALAIPVLPSLNETGVFDIAAGDFDGDGNLDIAVLVEYGNSYYNLSNPTSAVWVYYGNGAGTFSAAVLAGTFNRDAQTLTAGDLNGDGLADLVLTSYSVYQYTGVLVVHALPNRAWGPEVDMTGGEGLSPLWITDINHDGANDLIFSNAKRLNLGTDSISVLLNNPAPGVSGTLNASPEPSYASYLFTLNASLVPSNPADSLTGSVSFSLDGTVVGTAALAGNSAGFVVTNTGVAAGTHKLSATWPGNSTYPAITLNGSHTISLLPLKIALAATPTSLSIGSSVTATTTFTPTILPNHIGYQYTANMTLYDNGTAIAAQQVSRSGFSFTIPSLNVGTHVLSVSYPGDSQFSAAQSNSVTVTVTGTASTATLAVSPGTAAYGAPVTFSATIAAASPSVQSVPTGTVVFTVDGASLPPYPVTNSVATTVFSNLVAGPHNISCSYSGDTTFAPSVCNTVPLTIMAAASALTVNSSQNPSIAYLPVTFSAHLTLGSQPAPAGTQLTFIPVSGSSIPLTTDANGNAAYTTSQYSAGTWDVTASFSGTSHVSASTHYKQVVDPAQTTLSLTVSPNPASIGQTVKLTASTTPSGTTFPTGTITFLDGTTVVGAGTLNAAGQASFSSAAFAVGTHRIVATYPGDAGFLAGASAPVTLVITASDANLTTDRGSLTIETEHHSSINVSLASIGGLSGTFNLSCGSLPSWVTCRFASPTVTLPANRSVVTALDIDTEAVYHFKSERQELGTPAQPVSKLPLLCLAPFAWWVSGRRRRCCRLSVKGGACIAVSFILAGLGCAVVGCGDKYPDHTAPGNYAIQLTATSLPGSTPAPITRTVTFTLRVTP